MTDIPEDVMKAARSAATTRLFSDRADKQADELTRHISRAIMAERERTRSITAEMGQWLAACIDCESWMWDGDQKDAAVMCLSDARDRGMLMSTTRIKDWGPYEAKP